MATTYQGRPVQVLARDTDPTCAVWVYFLDDPDHDTFVPAHELVQVPA